SSPCPAAFLQSPAPEQPLACREVLQEIVGSNGPKRRGTPPLMRRFSASAVLLRSASPQTLSMPEPSSPPAVSPRCPGNGSGETPRTPELDPSRMMDPPAMFRAPRLLGTKVHAALFGADPP